MARKGVRSSALPRSGIHNRSVRPELQRLTDELSQVRISLATVNDTSRIASNGWTVGQVLDHLTKMHRKTFPVLRDAVEAAPLRNGDDPVRYSFIDRQLVRVMGGKSPVKLPVPSLFEPEAADAVGPEIKEACLESIDELLGLLAKADNKVLSDRQVTSPVNSHLRLGLLPYLDATVGHAGYHQKQI